MDSDFIGEPDSGERLAVAVCELARRDPRQARQVIESVTATLDEATNGKRTRELERLEAAALRALGLDARSMLAAVEKGTLRPAPRGLGSGEPTPREGPAAPPEKLN
jgi:hypothetical protein